MAARPRDQLSEPEPELTLGQLGGKLGQLEGTAAAQQAAIDGLGVRTARCEALLKPLEQTKPGQSNASARGATDAQLAHHP
eukprot:COSAG04_NODE_262_length_18654_cov_17.483751_14_plen_81_part_00